MVSEIKGFFTRETSGPRQGQAGAVRAEQAQGAPRSAAGAAARDDTVELSTLSEAIRNAARALAAEPAIDESRVRELKDAIASGAYRVDPERVALKLIEADNL